MPHRGKMSVANAVKKHLRVPSGRNPAGMRQGGHAPAPRPNASLGSLRMPRRGKMSVANAIKKTRPRPVGTQPRRNAPRWPCASTPPRRPLGATYL
jgi:hypothetical protein